MVVARDYGCNSTQFFFCRILQNSFILWKTVLAPKSPLRPHKCHWLIFCTEKNTTQGAWAQQSVVCPNYWTRVLGAHVSFFCTQIFRFAKMHNRGKCVRIQSFGNFLVLVINSIKIPKKPEPTVRNIIRLG